MQIGAESNLNSPTTRVRAIRQLLFRPSALSTVVRRLRVAISTVPDPSGSGRVDMLTNPVAAARAAVATGAWVKSKHDMYLIRGSVGA